MRFPGHGDRVFVGDTCFYGKFFGKDVQVKHDAWQGPNGQGMRRCVYCEQKVVG